MQNAISRIRKVFLPVIILWWITLSLVSINYLFPFSKLLVLPTAWLGYLGWGCFAGTVLYLGRNRLRILVLVFLLFFVAGYWFGPFLEPPGDPLDHLKLSYAFCDKKSHETNQRFKGLWQYSMNGVVLCSEIGSAKPERVIARIDVLNGLYWAGGASVLYLVASAAGLSFKWSLLSILIAFFFMGTNRFSYFSYYSFAPSFSSMWIFWLWIAAFFFRRTVPAICSGILTAMLLVPVILVNHIQEAVFLSFLACIWGLINLHERLWTGILADKGKRNNPEHRSCLNRRKWIYIFLVFVVLWIMPQSESFRQWLARFFLYDNWTANQDAVFTLGGWHLMGKIWSFRVHDTLGLLGVLPVFLLPFFFRKPFCSSLSASMRSRIFVLGVLPLLVYCIPLLHFIWLSNCERVPTHIRYYYRMCYISLFWLPITMFFAMLEEKTRNVGSVRWTAGGRSGNRGPLPGLLSRSVFWLCLLAILSLGTIRTGPVYGKTDFILLDSRRWFEEWKPMIRDMFAWRKQNIFTDTTTSNVLHSVFNLSTRVIRSGGVPFNGSDIRWLDRIGGRPKAECLVNLHGYPATWVPSETDHWSPRYGDTASYYSFNGLKADALREYLHDNPLQNCYVYY